MKAWDSFYPYILTDVIGAPVPLIDMKIRLACREFCRRTGVLQSWITPFVPVDGQSYALPVIAGREFVRVERAKMGDAEDQIGVFDESSMPPGQHIYPTRDKNTVVLSTDGLNYKTNIIYTGETLSMLIAYQPTLDSVDVEDFLVDKWGDVIASKAKALVQMTPGQPYTNPELARENTRQFETDIHRAANQSFAARTLKKTAKHPIS